MSGVVTESQSQLEVPISTTLVGFDWFVTYTHVGFRFEVAKWKGP